MVVQPIFIQTIIDTQKDDAKLVKIVEEVANGMKPNFTIHEDGGLYFKNRLCVPDDQNLKGAILDEAYRSRCTVHHGNNKTNRNFKTKYW